MSKSLTDITPQEQKLFMRAYDEYIKEWEDRISSIGNINPTFTRDRGKATTMKDFDKYLREDIKESFQAFGHPGGAFESFTYQTRGGEKEAWRWVEGANSLDQVRGLYTKKDKDKTKFKPSYERLYEDGIPVTFDKNDTFLKNVDPDKKLKTHKIKKSDYKKPKLPKSVRRYAEGSTPINNTAKLAINRLKADLNS